MSHPIKDAAPVLEMIDRFNAIEVAKRMGHTLTVGEFIDAQKAAKSSLGYALRLAKAQAVLDRSNTN
ncbi:hypothetical protein D3C84_868480 [compost metagenome]